MKICRARISTEEQSLDLRCNTLTRAGCEMGFKRTGVFGAKRLAHDAALTRLGPDKMLTVWRLDRLGRSLPHLIKTVRQLGDRGAGVASVSEGLDSITAGGLRVVHIMDTLAQFARSPIVDRVNACITAAGKRDKHVDRPPKLTAEQVAYAREAVDGGSQSPAGMAAVLGVSHSTLRQVMQSESKVA